MPDEGPGFDLRSSLSAFDRQDAEGAVKVWEDLNRYRAVIAASRPEVLVECGTFRGGSARWFASLGLDVVTVDIAPIAVRDEAARITWITGNSADPDVAASVAALVTGRRTMVVLDSSHHAEHVRREIELYGPLVSPGCYLVVEDGIVRWLNEAAFGGGPLVAIESLLVGNSDWQRDEAIEAMYPVSMYPMGWWRRAR